MKHFVTVYGEDGEVWIESWLQLNLFGMCFCFWRKKIPLSEEDYRYIKDGGQV